MALALPDGPRGRVLAIGLTVIVVALLWLGAVAPLLAWHAELSATREQRQVLASRMAVVADGAPALQRQLAAAPPGPITAAMLEGGTDAVAAAALQERIQAIGRAAGVTLTSVEALPATAVGRARRIGVRVALSGPWPMVIRFLQASLAASPRMLVDELQMQKQAELLGADRPLDVSLVVFGFRTAAP